MRYVEEDPTKVIVRPYVRALHPDQPLEARSQRVRPYVPPHVATSEQDDFTPERADALQAFHNDAEQRHGGFGNQMIDPSLLCALLEGLQKKL